MKNIDVNPYRAITLSLMKDGYTLKEALAVLSEVIVDQVAYDKMIDHWNDALELAQSDEAHF